MTERDEMCARMDADAREIERLNDALAARDAEVARLTRRTGELEKMLRFLSTYEKNPPEIVYDEWAYKRFLNFVHECAARALSGAAPTEGAES